MRAVVYKKYGGPEVLEIREIEKPAPKDDEVLVKVYAVSINDWDYGMMEGGFICRLMNGLFRPKKKILGSDIAGRIESVGKNVKKFKPGDEVFGDLSGRWGGFAEYVTAPEKSLVLKPAMMSFDAAAALPQAGLLAVQALIDKGHIKTGQRVLINGGGGGIGTIGVQVARTFGVELTGVDHTSKLDLMRSIGYDHVIDFTKEDFTRNGKCYDLIIDAKTKRSMIAISRALCRHGTYVTAGGSMGRFLLEMILLRPWISVFSKKRITFVALKVNKGLDYLNELFEAGKLKPVIDGPYKLEQAGEAFRIFSKGEHKGKIVFSV